MSERTAELVGGSRDGTVIVLPVGDTIQWTPDGEFEVDPETVMIERYVLTGKLTTAGHLELLFMGIDETPWREQT